LPIRAAIILSVARPVPLSPDIEFKEIAARMEGFTGADIEACARKPRSPRSWKFSAAAAGPFVGYARRFLCSRS